MEHLSTLGLVRLINRLARSGKHDGKNVAVGMSRWSTWAVFVDRGYRGRFTVTVFDPDASPEYAAIGAIFVPVQLWTVQSLTDFCRSTKLFKKIR